MNKILVIAKLKKLARYSVIFVLTYLDMKLLRFYHKPVLAFIGK